MLLNLFFDLARNSQLFINSPDNACQNAQTPRIVPSIDESVFNSRVRERNVKKPLPEMILKGTMARIRKFRKKCGLKPCFQLFGKAGSLFHKVEKLVKIKIVPFQALEPNYIHLYAKHGRTVSRWSFAKRNNFCACVSPFYLFKGVSAGTAWRI